MANFSDILSNILPEKCNKVGGAAIKYGTAGFRANADGLDFVVYRVGLVATLRSKSLGGKIIGLMITASHNPVQDNGVKLVDPKGEMLEASWEGVATRLANAEDSQVKNVIKEIVNTLSIEWAHSATIYIGRDTRPSSLRLAECAISAIEAIGGRAVDCGVVTTPMLHYFVAESNQKGVTTPPTSQDYYSKFANAFLALNDLPVSGKYEQTINFDGANGVGAPAMLELSKLLVSHLDVNIFNNGNGILNHQCGSDHVKVTMRAPEGVPPSPGKRCVSVDGDADRLLYFYFDDKKVVHVLDGDRIATLVAAYLMELLKATGLSLQLGLVQTAYANGAATDYISKVLKVPLACTETGVKHLHHKALEFDIGVYFEANGHGTVVYSERAVNVVRSAKEESSASQSVRNAAKKLWGMMELTNQAVGDALSDLLLVETVLRARGWSAADWEECYADLPSRLSKVTIKNRDDVTTTDAARRCLTPVGLQEEIVKLTAKYSRGRSFVRASGTEDVVRVYAEAATQEEADKLSEEVAAAVFRMAGGVS